MSSFIKKLDIQAILNQYAFIVKKLDLKTHLSDNKKKSPGLCGNYLKSRPNFVIIFKKVVKIS